VDPVRLVGQCVTLREFAPEDLAEVHAIVGDPVVTDWLSFDARDRAGAAAMLAGIRERAGQTPRTEYYLAVTAPPGEPGAGAPGGGPVVGFIRLGLTGVRAAKLGYAVRAAAWRRGYATDAARTAVAFGFGALGLHRISAAIGPDNDASVAVVRRLGFRYEGRLRDHVFTNGGWRDSLLYSLLAHEFPG
jgi:ribosomal-protein-alanine N-acetyltransferase